MQVVQTSQTKQPTKSDRDFVTLGIATAAIILLVATGSNVAPIVIDSLFGAGGRPDQVLVNALLLNIALILLGWRHYNTLTREISERRDAEEKARKLAEIDPLTGCLNRRSIEQATDALRHRANARGEGIVYVMIDIDNFKQINDINGHIVGDKVLVELSQRLRTTLPQDAIIARLGGDEFAFVMSYIPDKPEDVDAQILRLFDSATNTFEIDDLSIEATMSIGIATDQDASGISTLSNTASTLMHRADIAMYHSKKQGKNRYFWFEPTMETDLKFRTEIELGIRNGIPRGEFVPYYEQQIDLKTGKLVGFEMLARWHSPDLGLVSPDVFIPIAEEIGVIGEMSEKLMIKAFVDAREWDDDLTLSVNISPIQMRDPWFAQKLLKLLVEHNFLPSRLEIEITESCLHQNIGMVRSMIASLRNQGVKVSLDDFGTGYSSIEQLRTLPFDRIKIDRSFISELRNPMADRRIVDAIVQLGNGLELPMTAEGIEDQDTLDALREFGPLKGQGYLYGRPENASQVTERLMKDGRTRGRQEDPREPSAGDRARSEEALKTAGGTAE